MVPHAAIDSRHENLPVEEGYVATLNKATSRSYIRMEHSIKYNMYCKPFMQVFFFHLGFKYRTFSLVLIKKF